MIALCKLTQFYSNFQMPGQSFGNCFAFKKCLNCNEKCHIPKNCEKTHSAPTAINLHEGLTTEHLESGQPEQPEQCIPLLKFMLVINLFLFNIIPDLNTQLLLELLRNWH